MKKILIGILFFALFSVASADETDSLTTGNNILFFKDPRVDVLQKIFSRNIVKVTQERNIRVQVFQATSREKVFEARTQFSKYFPGIQTYITYASPNFKLRAGDFESQKEAFRFQQQTKKYFPMSFVIEEQVGPINKPKTKTK